MSTAKSERLTADIDGDFVVFLIGMRINRVWKPHRWLPVARAMPQMLIELDRAPELGLLHARTHFGFPNILVVQYWRSVAHLQQYAAAREHAHLPAWAAFNRASAGNDDVGIWHETYLIREGAHESVYVNMPAFGLGRAGRVAPATGARANAAGRLAGAQS